MTRSSRALIFLAVLLWHSMSMLGSWSVAQEAGEWQHLVVHRKHVDHHRHADNALHMEDGAGTAQHVLADCGASPAGLFALMQPVLSSLPPMSASELKLFSWFPPTLEGRMRLSMQRTW